MEIGARPADRVAGLDWTAIEDDLDQRGWSHRPALLTAAECRATIELFAQPERFRKTVIMEEHRFGAGVYKYFANPLPPLVAELRTAAYAGLAPIANRWRERVSRAEPFPPTLAEFLERCRAAGQTRPTPLMLHYRTGGYNELHRDLYGKVAFPLQMVIVLGSRTTAAQPGDFAGGEFLIAAEPKGRPAQLTEIPASQGDVVFFATKYRPEPIGTRWRQLPLRHGARPVTAGERHTLGIIFHDAQ